MEISITYAIKIWLTLWGTLETLSIWITSQYFHWINQPHIIKCTNIKINISYMCMCIIVLLIFAKLFFTGSSAIFIVIQGIKIQKNTNHLLFRWLWSVKCNLSEIQTLITANIAVIKDISLTLMRNGLWQLNVTQQVRFQSREPG